MKKIFAMCSLLMMFACSEKVVSLDGNYAMTNAPENAEITIAFEGNRFSGQSAINRYFGTFETEGTTIKFAPAGMTMMAGPENLMKVEQQYMQDLNKINAYQLNGKTLTLTGPDNLTLTFDRQ